MSTAITAFSALPTWPRSSPFQSAASRQRGAGVPCARSDGCVPDLFRHRQSRCDLDPPGAARAAAAYAHAASANSTRSVQTEEKMREALLSTEAGVGMSQRQAPALSARCSRGTTSRSMSKTPHEAFADPAIADMSLIVPIVHDVQDRKGGGREPPRRGRGSVSLAGYHGSMCDAFRDCVAINSCAAANGSPTLTPSSTIGSTSRSPSDPIVPRISSFPYRSETILHACRPFQTKCWRQPRSPASTGLGPKGVEVPVVWKAPKHGGKAASSTLRSATSRRSSACPR